MEYAEKYRILIQNLMKSKIVNSYDTPEEKESATLTHALLDMEEGFKAISDDLLPQLLIKNIEEEEVDDVLSSIGEKLRHILYHIHDPNYFNYLIEENED